MRTVSCYFFLRSSVIALFPKRAIEPGAGFEAGATLLLRKSVDVKISFGVIDLFFLRKGL
ncbi:MAG: hypothetical protein ABH874_00225 [Methanobacteriota archaeon]